MDTVIDLKPGTRLEKLLGPLKVYGLVPPDCNCDMRRDWLDRVPTAFFCGGIVAAKRAHEAVMKYYEKPR